MKITKGIFLLAGLILISAGFLSTTRAAEEDTYCYLQAATDVMVVVWNADNRGNKGYLLWKGVLKQGERKLIRTFDGKIRVATTKAYAKNAPLENLDIVYHYTSVVDLINSDFKLGENEMFVRVIDLPLEWQYKIGKAIEGVSCAKSVFAEISSLYDYADELEYNGQFEEGVIMRTKLNYISEFFVEKFEKDLED